MPTYTIFEGVNGELRWKSVVLANWAKDIIKK